MREEIEEVLERVKPALGGAEVKLEKVEEGIVTLRYLPPLANPYACHISRARITKDIIIEVIEDALREVIPDLKEVILLES